jgi:hypothetical protein
LSYAPGRFPFQNTAIFFGDLLLPHLFPEVIETLRKTDAVCFDVDSTVCLDEGIDELADFCGAGQAVAEWTAK